MTTSQKIITIGIVVIGTMLTRFLPFCIFPDKKSPPRWILRLGEVLPYAMMGMLVIYSLKEITFFAFPYGVPKMIGIFITALLHFWRKNMLLSIAGGTISYMLIVQSGFI